MHILIELTFSFAKLATLLLALALASIVACVTLRIYRHSKWVKGVDGPKSSSFALGHYVEFGEGDIVKTCLEWMRDYGGIVRHKAFLGEPRLLVSDPVALDHILVKQMYAYRKQPELSRLLVMIMGSGLLPSEGDQHRRQKRAIQAGFSPTSLRAYYPQFVHHTRHFRQCLLDVIANSPKDASEKHASVLIDILKPSARVSVDMLGHAAFGKPFDALKMEKDNFGILQVNASDPPLPVATHPLVRAFDSLIDTVAVASGTPFQFLYEVSLIFVPWFRYLPFSAKDNPKVKVARRKMDDEARELLKEAEEAERERVRTLKSESMADNENDTGNEKSSALVGISEKIDQSPQNPASILSFMMRARDMALRAPPRKHDMRLTAEDLLGQVTTIMVAGHETTSTMLAWMMRAFAQQPKDQEKLRKCIRDKRVELGLSPVSRAWTEGEPIVVPDDDTDADAGRELTLDELDSITYLDYCIQEMLRLHSPVHTSCRTATQDDVLPVDPEYSPAAPASGIPIHKGVTFIIPIEAINHDPKLWGPDADEYRPERWADQSLPGVQRFRAQKGAMSFLIGPRSCIGMRFTVAELKVVAAIVMPSIQFIDSERPVSRARWFVARPWDKWAGREQCPVRIAKT